MPGIFIFALVMMLEFLMFAVVLGFVDKEPA